MSRNGVAALVLLGALGMVGARCGQPVAPRPDARVPSTTPGTCDGFVDYADELVVEDVRERSVTAIDFGMVEVELDVVLRNAGTAPFRSASALPDLDSAAAAELLLASDPLAADFGRIEPGATAESTAPLLVRLPGSTYFDLIPRLESGALRLVVRADEENVLAQGVTIAEWTPTEDRMWYLASRPSGGYTGPLNTDPGAGPFTPGQEWSVAFFDLIDDVPTVFDSFAAGTKLYLQEDADQPFANLPRAFEKVRVVDAVRLDGPDDEITLWVATLKLTDTEDLPSLYANASFCSGTQAHLDPPVQATRLFSVDGDTVADEDRDGHEQPVRMNELRFENGIVTVSGQLAGHVLKPSLSLRLRGGRVVTDLAFDTDLSFAAEVRAEDDLPIGPEEADLWTLCYPLPSIPAGPISIPMNLQLNHRVAMEGNLAAGAVVGFSKHFESGFSVHCGDGGGCESEGHRTPTPLEFTPPYLTDETGIELRVETTLSAALRVGSRYPLCDAGAGVELSTTVYGELSVAPTQDPWWSARYGLTVDAAFELEILGLSLAHHDERVGEWEDGAASAPPSAPAAARAFAAGARTSGQDQRWSVAIDQTAVPNGVAGTDVAVLPDGSTLTIANEAIGGRNPLVKLDPAGALVWVKRFARAPQALHVLPDGSALVGGSASAWLVRLDADGNVLETLDVALGRAAPTTARCTLHDVAAIATAPGVYDYVVVGQIGTGLVTTTDACAFRVSPDGTIVWSHVYVSTAVQDFTSVIETRDGEIAVAGKDSWYSAGTRAVPLVVKLDAETGNPIWWKGMPMRRSAGLDAIVEAPDGTIFGAGHAGRPITQTGAALVARIGADGSDARHALVIQDEDWEAEMAFETWIDTAGGDSAYDVFYDIAQSGDGFVVVGRTGLGDATAARVAKVDRNLGVEWFTTFDGPLADSLNAVAVGPDAIYATGNSDSLLEADGGAGEGQLWVTKLPITGSVALLPEVGMTVRYLAPGVRFSSTDPEVNPLGEPAIDLPHTIEPAVFVSSGANAALVAVPYTYCVTLQTETGTRSLLDACAD